MKFTAACFLTIPFFSLAADAEESPWEFTGASGLSYADGNSETLAYSLQFLGSYIHDGKEAYIGADLFYSEDAGVEATDSLKIFGQSNYDLTERFYLGAYGSYFRDSVADIDYRIDSSVLLGYRAIDRDDMKLSFEAGPGYTWQDRGGMTSDFAILRVAEKFEYHFNDVTKFWQSLGLTPSVEDFSEYLLDFEMGIETRITDQWSLRTFLKHRIDSEPAAGKGRSDTSIMLGVAYDLNGISEPEDGGRRSLMIEDGGAGPDKGWISTAALGFSLNKGNSDSMGLSLEWNTEFRSDEREFFFDLAQTFRENNGASTEDQTISRIQYNHFLSRKKYLGTTLGYLRDGEADIDRRVTPGIIAGYYLIKTEATKLAFEAGPAYTFESVGGTGDSFVSIVAAERFSHKFNGRFTFSQAAEYTAEVGDFDNYSLLVTAGLDTKISKRLIWRVGAGYTFESIPAAGRSHHDTSVISSVAVRF